MNKYVFNILYNLLSEVKEYKKVENLEKICAILNNEITSANCLAVTLNDSHTADSFYGLIVYPKIVYRNNDPRIKSYVIEIQWELIKLLDPKELAAMIIHDISHNILNTTVTERLKLAIYKACKMTKMNPVDILHNMENKFRDLAIMDISNRTYKEPIIPGEIMYEPDRLLVDMDIWQYFNSAIEKTATIEYEDMSKPDFQEIADTHIGMKLIKMIREKIRGIEVTYLQLVNYINARYDTKVFTYYPTIEIEHTKEQFGEKISAVETMSPLELQFLHESTEGNIRKQKNTFAAKTLNMSFGTGKISYSALQKELDIINFKIDSMGSNYERLAILDRIYDNIFALEKFLTKNPKEKIVIDYLQKFIDMTSVLKSAKVERKRYGVFAEVPPGYEG